MAARKHKEHKTEDEDRREEFSTGSQDEQETDF
jgi:hypothetical protein